MSRPFLKFAPLLVLLGGFFAVYQGYMPFGVLLFLMILLGVFALKYVISSTGIIVSTKYLVFGNHVVVYDNIKLITIDENKKRCGVRRKNDKRLVIAAEKFTTNARKGWKVKKNKEEKFYKVVTKILDSALAENPNIIVQIIDADRLKEYQSVEV